MVDAFAAVFPDGRGRTYSKASYLCSQTDQGHLEEAFTYLQEFMSEHFAEDSPGKPESRWPDEVRSLANSYAEALATYLKGIWTNERLTRMFENLELEMLTPASFWLSVHDQMVHEVFHGRDNAFGQDSDFHWMLGHIRTDGFFEALGNAAASVIVGNPNGWLLSILNEEEHLEFMHMLFDARGGEVAGDIIVDRAPEYAWSILISRSSEILEHNLRVEHDLADGGEFSPAINDSLLRSAIAESLMEMALDVL